MSVTICDDLSKQIRIIKNATLEYFKSQHGFVEIETLFNEVTNNKG